MYNHIHGVPEGPKATFSIDIVYANFSITEGERNVTKTILRPQKITTLQMQMSLKLYPLLTLQVIATGRMWMSQKLSEKQTYPIP